MAIRRAKMKAQVIEKLTQAAPAGETFIACIHAETGPSPWLNAIFDEIPGVGLVVALTRKFYFLTLTNTSVVVNNANRWTNRPGDIVAVFPREAFPVSRIKRVKVWNSMYVEFTPGAKPTRLNVHGYWRNELDQFIAVFPQSALADAAIPAQATAPAGDPTKTV
jgi:hypothetical protein